MDPFGQTRASSPSLQHSGSFSGQQAPALGTVPVGQQRAFFPLPRRRPPGQHTPPAQMRLLPSQQIFSQQSSFSQQRLSPQFTLPLPQHFPREQDSPFFAPQQYPSPQFWRPVLQHIPFEQYLPFGQHSPPQLGLPSGQTQRPLRHFWPSRVLQQSAPVGEKQHSSPLALLQHVPNPLFGTTQTSWPFGQQRLRSFDPQNSPGSQHACPHTFSSGQEMQLPRLHFSSGLQHSRPHRLTGGQHWPPMPVGPRQQSACFAQHQSFPCGWSG